MTTYYFERDKDGVARANGVEESTKGDLAKTEDDFERDVQALITGLKNAKKEGPKIIEKDELVSLQDAEAKMRTKKGRAQMKTVPHKRPNTAEKPGNLTKFAKPSPAPTFATSLSSGLKIRLERMKADVACMNPGPDGGDGKANIKAIEDLIVTATEALERFRR